ncbi:hypothetical protein [Roseburia faecis]|uniref:hypothetical protein n=1 Tax=Roseburia faecis TaxID=301302 RepID=UPI003F97D5A7
MIINDSSVANKKVSDIKDDDVLKGFVALAEIGVHSKEDIQNKIDELEAKIDEYNSEDADLSEGFREYEDLGDSNNKTEKERLANEYGTYEELCKKREELNKERNRLSKYVDKLQAALENYKNFDKRICFSNIRFLLAENPDIKVGQIEREANVRLGYTARLEKPDNTAEPSVEFIVSAAKLLGVSLDSLLNVDMQELTPTEKYLATFVEKLKKDTLEDKLEWNVEYENQLNHPECDINGNPNHNILNLETFMEEGETGYPEEVTRTTFNSHSFGPNTWFDGDSFNLRMKNGSFLYILSIEKSLHDTRDLSAFVKEIWMYSPGSGLQFLMASNDGTPLACLVEPLYNVVKTQSRHPKLKKGVKSVIEAFMNDDLEDDPDPFPFDNGNLPFN